MGYAKLFDSIIASSVWDEDDKTRIVWVTMLALKNRDHFVRGTENFLALAARVSAADLKRALAKLSAPDKQSRTQENDGRRIKAEAGGWVILNGEAYQHRLSQEERREYNRTKQAEYRKRKKVVRHEGACAGAQQAIKEGLGES